MQPPTYNSSVPESPSDSLAESQPDILNNFLTLYNSFMVNHIPLDAVSGAGNHTIVQFIEQKSPPQTLGDQIAIYAANVSGQTDQIFIGYPSNGTQVQFTNYQLYSLNQPPNQTAFFTFLPGKILIYFGSFTSLPNNTLNLFPEIAKNIISASFCSIGTSPKYKPRMQVQQNPSGFFNAITLKSSNPKDQTLPGCYYIVMANI